MSSPTCSPPRLLHSAMNQFRLTIINIIIMVIKIKISDDNNRCHCQWKEWVWDQVTHGHLDNMTMHPWQHSVTTCQGWAGIPVPNFLQCKIWVKCEIEFGPLLRYALNFFNGIIWEFYRVERGESRWQAGDIVAHLEATNYDIFAKLLNLF